MKMSKAMKREKENGVRDWIHDAKNGNEKSFEKLVKQYEAMIQKALNKYPHISGYTEEDKYQELLVAFYRAIKRYDLQGKNSFSTYVYILMDRQLGGILIGTKWANRRANDDGVSLDGVSNQPEESLYEYIAAGRTDNYVDDLIDIQDSLVYLTDRERKIFKWRYFDSKKQVEIAKILGISSSAVRDTEVRALEKVRAVVKNENLETLLRRVDTEERYEILSFCNLSLGAERSKVLHDLTDKQIDRLKSRLSNFKTDGLIIYSNKMNQFKNAVLTSKGQELLNRYHKVKGINRAS